MDHKKNIKELPKPPLPNTPFFSHHSLEPTMATPLDTHLAFIQLARTQAHWTAKENSDWDSLVGFLLTKSTPVPPAVQFDTLRHSLSRAAGEIAAATAALGNTVPPGNISDAWPPPPPPARSSPLESPPRHSYRGAQGISPSPKKTKVTNLPVKLNKYDTERAKELLADYYPAHVLERTVLVPYKDKFPDPYPNLPWAITVYGALYKDTPNPTAMLSHNQAVSAAQTACARFATHDVHRIIEHIAHRLRLPIQRCPEISDTTAIAAANKELVVLAYKVDKKDCGEAPHIHFIIVCTRSMSILPLVKYPACVFISHKVKTDITTGNIAMFQHRIFDNFCP